MENDPRIIKDELIKIYPKKVARKRGDQIVVNQLSDGRLGSGNQSQCPHQSGDHYPARLHLCGLQGRSHRPQPRHPQHYARPHRLRLL